MSAETKENPQPPLPAPGCSSVSGLQYIVDSPAQEHGGFHPRTVQIARLALVEMGHLRRQHRSLFLDLEQALDDWIATYAAECCDKEAEAEAMRRIESHGGTLCYVTDLRERVAQARKGQE